MPIGWKTAGATTMLKILLLQCFTPLFGLVIPPAQFSIALEIQRLSVESILWAAKERCEEVGILGLSRGTRAAASASDVTVAVAVHYICDRVSLSGPVGYSCFVDVVGAQDVGMH